jgi:hypothetical protein
LFEKFFPANIPIPVPGKVERANHTPHSLASIRLYAEFSSFEESDLHIPSALLLQDISSASVLPTTSLSAAAAAADALTTTSSVSNSPHEHTKIKQSLLTIMVGGTDTVLKGSFVIAVDYVVKCVPAVGQEASSN